MKTGMQQHTGLRQELRINPRLYQAMDMLYMDCEDQSDVVMLDA